MDVSGGPSDGTGVPSGLKEVYLMKRSESSGTTNARRVRGNMIPEDRYDELLERALKRRELQRRFGKR